MNDAEYLKRYVALYDQEAFRNLVERHSGMVYGAALRKTGQPHLAEEATQTVFVQLAKKAASLRKPECLAAWLHRSVVLESVHLMRQRQRYSEKLERLADAVVSEPDHEGWRDVVPHLDHALNQLSQTDRQLVLDRFYQEHSFAEIAVQMRKTEVACRKQVSRVLDKLARLLQRQGVAVSSVVLANCLHPEFAVASPVGLAEVIEGRVADLSSQAAEVVVSSSLLAIFSSKVLMVSLAALSAVTPMIWKKPLAASEVSLSSNAAYSVLGLRQARQQVLDQNVSIDDILAASGTEQLALLMQWLPKSETAGVEDLARAQRARTQSSGLAGNAANFWPLLMHRWLELDADMALAFADSTRKLDDGRVLRDLFDVDTMFVMWAKASPDAALAAAQKRSTQLVVRVLNDLQNRDPGKVLELSQGLDPGVAAMLNWGGIFEVLAKRDLKAATRGALAMPESRSKDAALFAVAMATVESDPKAALMMLEGRSKMSVYSRWLESDPDAAIAAIEILPETVGKLTLLREAGSSLASRDLDKARAWAMAHRDPEEQRAALVGIAVEGAKLDPLGAKSVFDALGWDLRDPDAVRAHGYGGSSISRGSVETLESAAERVILEVSKTDRSAALALCQKIRGASYARREAIERIATGWLAEDRRGFVKEMLGQESGHVRDRMMDTYAELIVREEPQEALHWAINQDVSMRASATIEVLQEWKDLDPTATLDAFLAMGAIETTIKEAFFSKVFPSMPRSESVSSVLHGWLAEQADREDLPRAHAALGGTMAMKDLAQAAEWVAQLDDSSIQQSAIEGVVSALVIDNQSDREETLGWINQMEHSYVQQFWLKTLAKKWLRDDPESAREVVPTLPLSKRNLSRLMNQS